MPTIPATGGGSVRATGELERLRQRVAELELRCEEYRVLDETADWVPFRLQPDLQRFTYVGPQAAHLLGIAMPHWFEPGAFEARLAPEDRLATLEQFRLVVEFAAEHEAEFRLRRDDGAWMWLRCAMRIFTSSTGPMLAGHFTDITVRKTLASDHAQAQKLEGIGRLAAGIAHEINTPIQYVSDNITFVSEALTEVFGVVEQYRQSAAALPAAEVARLAAFEAASDLPYLVEHIPTALTHATEGLQRVAKLVRSMKEFAHPDGSDRARADINKALESTLTISANEYRGVADIETAFGDVPHLRCYISELNQVFLNIIVNAAHAISDVVGTSGARGKIRVSTMTDGGDLVVAIADTGGGISAHVADRIFDPFFTTKDVGRGSGQGLSIAHAIVDRHGGALSFETTAGQGTTFFVRLPIG